MTRSLCHLTLGTGHVRQSPRSEVGDDAIVMLRPVLERALRGTTPMPGPPGYELRAAKEGNALMVTVSRVRAGAPLVEIAVAPDDAASAALWAHVTRLQERAGLPRRAQDLGPSAPWCTAVLLPGLAADPEAAHWLGDLERCIAWTWIEMS